MPGDGRGGIELETRAGTASGTALRERSGDENVRVPSEMNAISSGERKVG